MSEDDSSKVKKIVADHLGIDGCCSLMAHGKLPHGSF